MIYMFWRDRLRHEIETWGTRQRIVFYGAAALIVLDLGVLFWPDRPARGHRGDRLPRRARAVRRRDVARLAGRADLHVLVPRTGVPARAVAVLICIECDRLLRA